MSLGKRYQAFSSPRDVRSRRCPTWAPSLFWCDESSLFKSFFFSHHVQRTPSRCWRFLPANQILYKSHWKWLQTNTLLILLWLLYVFSGFFTVSVRMGWLWLTGCKEITVLRISTLISVFSQGLMIIRKNRNHLRHPCPLSAVFI